MNTDAFHAAAEETVREVCVCGTVAAAVVPTENHTVSAACLRENGLDLEV